MPFFNKSRRKNVRYPVLWSAELDVRFSDLRARWPVTVTNFSALGALIQSETIFARGRMLIGLVDPPAMALVVTMPDDPVRLDSQIRWYRLDGATSRFEIGIAFNDEEPETAAGMDRLLESLRAAGARPPGLCARLKNRLLSAAPATRPA